MPIRFGFRGGKAKSSQTVSREVHLNASGAYDHEEAYMLAQDGLWGVAPFEGSGGTTSYVTRDGKPYVKHVFSYTGSDQTFTISAFGTSGKAIVKVWGAAGGGGTSYYSTYGGPGGFGYGTVHFGGLSGPGGYSATSTTLKVMVGAGGGRNTVGERTIYGHVGVHSTNYKGGWGSNAGNGGGLTGLFDSTITQANSIIIAGGGGGSGQINNQRVHGAGGPGGGVNQNGSQGYDNPDSQQAFGRGGTTTAGGNSGLAYYRSPNGAGPNSIATGGGALIGGHAHTTNSWTEGGGGGSGYYGGGSGAHAQNGGYWSAAGGGSGYASSRVSDITAYTGSYESQNSNATSDVDYVSGVSTPNAGNSGGNGLLVILYPRYEALT